MLNITKNPKFPGGIAINGFPLTNIFNKTTVDKSAVRVLDRGVVGGWRAHAGACGMVGGARRHPTCTATAPLPAPARAHARRCSIL